MSEMHCPSYYAATLNDKTAYPSLEGEITADVCVIGGGFTGVSTALDLTERGFNVVLLEQNHIGWGASGRNGGQVGYSIKGEDNIRNTHGAGADQMIKDLQWRGHEIIKKRIKKYNIDCDFKPGDMAAAIKHHHMDELKKEFNYVCEQGWGDNFKLVEKAQLRDYIGTDKYVGGLYNDMDFHIHPLNLCIGEARAAASLGARIFEGSGVVEIIHGKNPVVVTKSGRVKVNKVVIAGNAYHHLEKKKIGGVVFPAGTYILATEPLDSDLATEILPKNQSVWDMSIFLAYFRRSADNRFLYGGECNYSGRDPRSIKDTMLPHMIETFPMLKNVKIDYEWGGMIGITISRTPHVGRINDNVYYAQGYSGHGVNVTHIMGEMLSDAITGQLEHFDLFEKAKQHRIPVPRWVGNQMLALGMLYYRIKELL
ncbi:MAG: FAD-binding oxidoreductase [Kordiimonadaceae bacterium]|mgnify:CR=1 FL=1|jgi:gamma-glutamylputrescine oxidase|nr:FAD-binding oxidoreductase [Kordiimonadaceae bacterium]MBT6034954.1 FAD-binding oxidoreductase [Kordiimonadaceae bacterium]MBT6330499.1 FAD-binding oxidoreductase [Kordiimonadaceae bacterium]MBT7582971.1 FAD-binding oxidoreductase [Kordiimonadaceae bacterium]